MRSSTIALTVGLLAAPLALITSPGTGPAPVSFVNPVSAQQLPSTVHGRPLQDAPISKLPPAGISPADRVEGPGGLALDAGPANGTPFSDTPSGTLSGGATQGSSDDAVRNPADANGGTPNLSR